MKTIKLGYEGEEALLLCRELKRNGYSVKESRTFTQEMKEGQLLIFNRKTSWMLMESWDIALGKFCSLQGIPLPNV